MRTHNKFANSLLKTFVLISAFFVAGATFAQGYAPDSAEVLRRGNSVEHVAGTQADAETVSLAALAPPPDDSHKWFITLVKQPGCKPCAKLLNDFSTDANLRAFADLSNGNNSWSHFHAISINDETQAWRFEKFQFKGFPTLLIQPPRNGRYGNPAKIIHSHTGYDGNAKKLADEIRAAVRKQAAKADAEKNVEGKRNANDQCPSTNDQSLASMLASITPTAPLRVAANHVPSNSPPFTPPKNEPVLPFVPNNNNAPLLPPAVPADIDPDAKPAQPSEPEKIPAPAIDPNKIDPSKIVAPNVDPTKIVSPSTPDPNKSAPSLYPQHPEAVVIVDKFADTVAKDASWAKIRSAVQRMQRDRPGLIVRVLDRRDAVNYPVQPSELPAIITTSEGRIETKLDKTLLETVTNDAPAFPWQALLSLFTGGFSWVGIGALGIWAIAVIRRWRIAQGKKLLVDNESAGRIRELLEKLFERIGEKK